MNVLILSAAAKVLLVRAFQRALDGRGVVVAADLNPTSPALHAADRGILLPPTGDQRFADRLEEVCRTRASGLVVPTRDEELVAVAECRDRLAAIGAAVAVSSTETITRLQDKRLFVEFCHARGFGVPHRFSAERPPTVFPVFARPRFGAGGRDARWIDDAAALATAWRADPDLLVDEGVTDPEYSIDCLLDFDGVPLQAVVRSRLTVRHGESTVSRVEDLPDLAERALALCSAAGVIGPAVAQAFRSADGRIRFIEVNPRFGGATNLSIEAGLAMPERLLGLLSGDPAARRPRPIRIGLTLLRHGADLLVPWSRVEGLSTAPQAPAD